MRHAAVTALVLASLVAGGMAFGQDCLQPVGWWAYQQTNSVAVSGTTAVFGGYSVDRSMTPQLMVADVSDAAHPNLLGALQLPGGSIEDIAVTPSSLSLVANLDAGLQVVDVSNPSAPSVVGSCATPGYARHVAVAGSVAVVSDGSLRMIAFGGPEPPHEVGAWEQPAGDVAVSGSYAYVGCSAGLCVLDISDPSAPLQVGSLDVVAYRVAVAGSYAYVLQEYPALLRVVDVSNPAAPVAVGSMSGSWAFTHLAAAGALVFVGCDSGTNMGGSVWVIDASNPAAPTAIGSVATLDVPLAVATANGHVYAAEQVGLRLADVSVPSSPQSTGVFHTKGDAYGATAAEPFAFVASRDVGLRIFDVSTPTRPLPVASFETDPVSSQYGVTVRGSLLYLAAYDGLFVLDVTVPTAPVQLGFCPVPYFGIAVDVEGTTAYVAAAGAGLRIVDVADPSAPVEIGSFATPFANQVAVAGSVAYVADQYSGMRVVDVSDPSAPVEIGSYVTPGGPQGITLDADHAYLADFDTFRVLDITDPTTPVEVGSFPTWAYRVAAAGSYAYVVDAAVRALDVSDPTTPVDVGFFEPYPAGVLEVALAGAHVYAPGRFSGFQVLTRCEMFADGFECGSTAAWAATLP